MRQTWFDFVAVVLCVGFCLSSFIGGFYVGKEFQGSPEQAVASMNNHQAVEFIQNCIDSHQYYIDHPDACNKQVGSVEFHQQVNENYKALLSYLEQDK